jgi:hypothetical protein
MKSKTQKFLLFFFFCVFDCMYSEYTQNYLHFIIKLDQ